MSTFGWDWRSPRCLREWRAPRRLLTSHQGRTGRGDRPARVEKGEEWQQAGQSRGVRGLSRRRTTEWSALARQWVSPGWITDERPNHARESMRKNTNT